MVCSYEASKNNLLGSPGRKLIFFWFPSLRQGNTWSLKWLHPVSTEILFFFPRARPLRQDLLKVGGALSKRLPAVCWPSWRSWSAIPGYKKLHGWPHHTNLTTEMLVSRSKQRTEPEALNLILIITTMRLCDLTLDRSKKITVMPSKFKQTPQNNGFCWVLYCGVKPVSKHHSKPRDLRSCQSNTKTSDNGYHLRPLAI